MRRRPLLLGAAVLSGVGGSIAWRARRGSDDAEAAGLWQARFDRPGGDVLDMATLRGRPMVINFWGTWCPPCVREMPELDRFQREFASKGWQVVGLAIDNPRAVVEFLARRPVSYAIGLAGFEGSALAERLGNPAQGGLPYTVLFDGQGRRRQSKAGQTDFAQLAAWAGEL